LPFLDGWSVITGLAEATKSLRLGVLVTCNSYRNPGLLAKTAVTADHISAGRVELGLGAGWMEEEYAAYGYDFPPVRTRLEQLDEALTVITSLFTSKRTTHTGAHYAFQEAPFEPKPLQHPLPITIGGAGPNVLMRMVARHAQRWNCPMPAAPRLVEHVDALAHHCSDLGRDPHEIVISEQITVVIGKDSADLRTRLEVARATVGGFVDLETMAVCGTPQAVVDGLSTKIERGVRDFAILFGDLGTRESLELFAEHVMPALKIP
jgi:alkanesulfonate monooxygenase SsuD/methylene tetrahydromethanopterin reductase-like flavin-dependent oxidoreductase (luciferase family)